MGDGAKRTRRLTARGYLRAVLVGAHVSPAGGLVKALERGRERGCEAIQIFNQNPRAWKPREYPEDEVGSWHAARADTEVQALLIHAVYLLNCASEDADIREKSLTSLVSSLPRTTAIGATEEEARRRTPAGRDYEELKENGLAGTVQDAEGRVLVFAFLSNGPNPVSVRPRLDALAAGLRSCGCH